jgi:hypothetical protein
MHAAYPTHLIFLDLINSVMSGKNANYFRETGYGDGRRMRLTQYHVQWQILAFVVLNLQGLFPPYGS